MIRFIKYICLACLIPTGINTLWISGLKYVGLEEMLQRTQDPNFSGPRYTGFPIIDIPLSFYMLAFGYISDSAVSPTSLLTFALYGGVEAICMLTALDNCRIKPWKQVRKE